MNAQVVQFSVQWRLNDISDVSLVRACSLNVLELLWCHLIFSHWKKNIFHVMLCHRKLAFLNLTANICLKSIHERYRPTSACLERWCNNCYYKRQPIPTSWMQEQKLCDKIVNHSGQLISGINQILNVFSLKCFALSCYTWYLLWLYRFMLTILCVSVAMLL